jgi:O-antigen ligase
MLLAYVLGTYVCAIATINNLLAGRTSGELTDADLAYKSGRYTMEGLNPNDLGLMLALSIPMTLYLLVRRKDSPLTQVVCWVQFVLALITIVLSGSRGAMLAASAGLLMFPAAVFRMSKPQKIVAGLMCAAAVAAAVSLVPPDTWGRFLKFGTEVTEGTMTHRTQIWTASLEVFRDHAFVGVGAGAHPAAVVKILARALVTHNTFLSVLVELGVVGELILLGLLAASFHRAARIGGLERILWIVALATWCVGVCGGTWEYRKTTWFLFALLAAHAFTLRFRPRDAVREAA